MGSGIGQCHDPSRVTEQLRDDLPEVLQRVAAALLSNQRYETDLLAHISPKHGAVRYDQGFNLNEVLVEFSILRSTLVQQVAAHLRRDLQTAEVMALGAALDLPFGYSISRFVDHLTHQLQAATEAQSKYLSFLSHDLRGGLNGVFLMIEVLKRELIGEERLAEVTAARTAAEADTRTALAAELASVRGEADQALASELTRVRAEAAQRLAEQLQEA